VTTWKGHDDPSKWYFEERPLDDCVVLQHLAGDAVPPHCPKWVAPWADETTQWIAFDVDLQDDEGDFRNRCEAVERALHPVGIDRDACLVSQTPSGGKHFRFFLSEPIRVADLASTMSRLGLKFAKGRIELFPSPRKGLRLPFGLIPTTEHDPAEAGRFIRKWNEGLIKRFDWHAIVRLLPTPNGGQETSPNPDADVASVRIQQCLSKEDAEAFCAYAFGAPSKQGERQQPTGIGVHEEYDQLLTGSLMNYHTADALWKRGIKASGTRYLATNRMAGSVIELCCSMIRWTFTVCELRHFRIGRICFQNSHHRQAGAESEP
jgi:hypothetical protein